MLGAPTPATSDLRAYARRPARGVKSGGWGAKAAVVAVVVVVGDGVVQHSPKMGQDNAKMGQRSASIGQTSAHDADKAPRCGTHFQHYLGLCWAMLTHREQQARKNNVKNPGVSGARTWGRLRFLLRRRRAPLEGHGPDGAHAPGRTCEFDPMC